MLFRVEESISTATVESIVFTGSTYDVLFGVRDNPGDPIDSVQLLHPGQGVLQRPRVFIRDDFIVEDEECFTIRVTFEGIPGRAEFTCDDGAGATNFFCEHTICIEDDDGKFSLMSTSCVIVLWSFFRTI